MTEGFHDENHRNADLSAEAPLAQAESVTCHSVGVTRCFVVRLYKKSPSHRGAWKSKIKHQESKMRLYRSPMTAIIRPEEAPSRRYE